VPVAEVDAVAMMMLDSFDGLLQAAREQPEGQRFLLVFVKTALPGGLNQAQIDRFHQGQGGALVPVMYADKGVDEIESFEDLVAESEKTGTHLGKGMDADWDMVIVGCLGGYGARVPTSMEAQLPLDDLLRTIRHGGALTHLVGFDRQGTPIQFQ
jgi:hypothetical protein